MYKKGCFQFCFVLFLLLCCVSCRITSKEQSFSAKLDNVDVFITTGDTGAALKLLNKISKQAFNSFQYLGVYRRYIQLGDAPSAEKCLLKGLKKFPDNAELRAVYTWFLYERNRVQEAYESAENLYGTPYASVLAEFRLKEAASDKSTNFFSKDFADIYADAYVSSREQAWLRNAAIVYAMIDSYDKAYSYHPKSNMENPLFWAYIAYDSRHYNSAIEYLSGMGKNETEALFLLSDIYSVLGNQVQAEKVRNFLIDSGVDIPPQIYANSARYANKNNDINRESMLLERLVQCYPKYLPGLAMYADVALKCLTLPPEDKLALAVRATGFRSAGMQEYDKHPKFTVSDTLHLLQTAVSDSNDPAIATLLFSFETQNDVSPDLLREEKVASLWMLLEKYAVDGAYPSVLVEYAVPVFLTQGLDVEARHLFDGYLLKKYGSKSYAEIMFDLSPKECEYAAYFSASDSDGNSDIPLALHLYNFIVTDKTERFPDLASSALYQPESEVLVNLAELYAGCRQFSQAKELYSLAVGVSDSVKEKAEIMYRLGNLQFLTGDVQSARISLEYCLSLSQSHAKARILRNKLSAD